MTPWHKRQVALILGMLDNVVIFLILSFAVAGMLSGFLLQVLRLLAAGAATVVVMEFSRPVAAMFPNLLASYPMARGLVFPVGVFTVSYLVFSMIAVLLRRLIVGGNPGLSLSDRILGAVLGAIKGALIAWLLLAILLAVEERTGQHLPRITTADSTAAALVKRFDVFGWNERLQQ